MEMEMEMEMEGDMKLYCARTCNEEGCRMQDAGCIGIRVICPA